MAIGVFNPAKHYKVCVYGHCFDRQPVYVSLPGRFVANTVDRYDPMTREREFAVFVVDLPKNGEYPVHWSGTYKIPMSAIKANPPEEIP